MRRLAGLLLACVAAAAPDANTRLERLLQEDLDAQMHHRPTRATGRGDRRFDDRLEDRSAAARRSWIEHLQLRLKALGEIDRSLLTRANRTNASLLEYELNRRLETAAFKPWQMPVSQLGGPQHELPQLPSRANYETHRHFGDYLQRLQQVPRYLDQVIADMREGLAEKRTPPRVTMGAAAEQALGSGTEAQRKDPTLHPMYPPFPGWMAKGPMAAHAREIISTQVVPAFRKLGVFLRDEYIPNCRETIAASRSVDGPEWYKSRLRFHTTLDLSADEIHERGLAEVKRIRAEMMKVIAETDFGRKDDFDAFVAYLRTDPRFYPKTADELLDGYRALAKRIDAYMPRLFGKLPRLAYGVKEMPHFIAPAGTTAYYDSGSLKTGTPGYFVANTFRLDQRPKYEMIALTLHEAVPGHHHQIALAHEMEGAPEWRTVLWYSAFGEGWALYSERLGLEMGDLMKDPYDRFGGLSYEMWRAMRLVVDTGLHAKDWTRVQAIDFMLKNSALTRQNVEKEVDRYIAWPGQATAYKIGELLIRRLRAKAKDDLGEDFDLRAFHDMILAKGSIPLPLLEKRALAWIAERR